MYNERCPVKMSWMKNKSFLPYGCRGHLFLRGNGGSATGSDQSNGHGRPGNDLLYVIYSSSLKFVLKDTHTSLSTRGIKESFRSNKCDNRNEGFLD